MYDNEYRVITPDMLADDPFHPSIIDFESDMSPAPFFAIALIAVNLLIFLWELKTGALKSKEAIIAAGAIYAEKVFSGEMWRIVTGMFLHGGWGHLIGNSLSLYLLALAAERAWGGWRAFVIYFCSGLAASLVSASMQARPAVGASGAIFGLMGAVVVFFYRYREAFRPRDRRIGKILLLWGIYQVVMGAITPYVDNCAHLGGAAAGAVFGALLPPIIFLRRPGCGLGKAVAGAALALLALLCAPRPGAAGAAAPGPDPAAVRWCYCIQARTPTPMDPVPYFIGKIDAGSPECAAVKLDFGGKQPMEALLFCPELSRCRLAALQYAHKKRTLRGRLAEEEAPSAACLGKCLEVKEGKVRALKAELEMTIILAQRSWETCFSTAAPPFPLDAAPARAPGDGPLSAAAGTHGRGSPAWNAARDLALAWCEGNEGCPEEALEWLVFPDGGDRGNCLGSFKVPAAGEDTAVLRAWSCGGGAAADFRRRGGGWEPVKVYMAE